MNLNRNLFVILATIVALVSDSVFAQGNDKPLKKPDTHEVKTGHSDAERPSYLQSISVTIHAGRSQGSGVIKTRGDTNYVWTAAHVVEALRSTRQVVDPKTGSVRTVVEFKDAKVVTELIEDGRSVGKIEMDAEVLRYSDADTGEDLALLRIRKKNFIRSTVRFYLDDKIPPIGTRLLHVGSLLGQMGSNSLTSGIISQHGRVIKSKVYDQTTCAAFPGSSGGGVYLESDGRYIGMIVRGAGETFNLTVPIRRMREWAARSKIEFALDDSFPVPSEEELRKTPVEEIGVTFSPARVMPETQPQMDAESLQFPFLIHRQPSYFYFLDLRK
jgi:S1-C subfamily serine protease